MTTSVLDAMLAGRSTWIALHEADQSDPDGPHCTLVFVGKLVVPESADVRAQELLARDTAYRWHLSLTQACDMTAKADPSLWGAPRGPIEARVGGIARFRGSVREGDPEVYLLQSQAVRRLRGCVLAAIRAHGGPERADDFDYTPHVTRGRVARDRPLEVVHPRHSPFTFSHIALCSGESLERWELGARG